MSFINLARNVNKFYTKFASNKIVINPATVSLLSTSHNRNWKNYKNGNSKILPICLASVGGIFSFLKKDEETPEDKLTNIIKRSILCIEREEYKKAETMLHLALRAAQDIQHSDGITYVYDLMANLAMDQYQYEKAEKLFTTVMSRLLQSGIHDENSSKVLHISAKIAHMAHIQGNFGKAEQGFNWTLAKLEENVKKLPEDKDMRELLGLTKNWFAKFLMEKTRYQEAYKYFEESYNIYCENHEKWTSEAILLVNNIAVACAKAGDPKKAMKYLEEAIEEAKKLPDLLDYGILQVNLAMIYLQDGVESKARELCKSAWNIGKKYENQDLVDRADECLEKIKTSTS